MQKRRPLPHRKVHIENKATSAENKPISTVTGPPVHLCSSGSACIDSRKCSSGTHNGKRKSFSDMEAGQGAGPFVRRGGHHGNSVGQHCGMHPRGGTALAISDAPSGDHGQRTRTADHPKTDKPSLEMGVGRKFQAKSSGWDGNRTFPKAMFLKLRYAMAAGVLTHAPAEPRPARPPVQHYFSTEE
jgi:hypothetical protein